MEAACQLGIRNATILANWLPSLQNVEADLLSNSDFRHFYVIRRVPVDLAKLEFLMLNETFLPGVGYLEELAALKLKGKRGRNETNLAAGRRPKKSVPLHKGSLVRPMGG